MKVHIYPDFAGEDQGDGGIRRVVEAQQKYFPKFGMEITGPEEADIIACHATAPDAYFNRFPQKPLVALCHGLYWSDYEWPNWSLKANQDVMSLIRAADAVTAPSEWVADAIRRNTSRDVTTIYHGVDVSEWETEEEKLPYVLWNKTRPDPVCDPTPVNLVAALLPQVQFVTTFGDESYNVKVIGKQPFDTARNLVKRASVYLATSKETFGIGTLEAMAAGVPVAGYRWGGQIEIVRQGLDGILAAPNDPGQLAQAITNIFAARDRLGEQAKERAREFTWEKATQDYKALFERVIGERTRKRPRTSIIVTNYNLDRYLKECLDSVSRQSDEDWECIVVDDASTTESGRDIVRSYEQADERFHLVANQNNVYLAEARNIGIRKAQGNYILPLDADDMLTPGTVKALADSLDKDRTLHMAYGKVFFVKEDGQTPVVYEGHEETPGSSLWPTQFRFESQMRQLNMLPYSSMYRRDVWKLTGGYSPRCRTAEDATFWSRAVSYGFRPARVTEGATLVYRTREGSMSSEQKEVQWIDWFPWAKDSKLTPAGACTATQLPIPSYDRIMVSVVIPVGPNHTKLLKDAIDSVDAQTYRDWECIVVNDSGKSLSELPSWVRVIETGSDLPAGVAAARNLGIRAAKAPLFLPLDADDYLQPDALAAMVSAYLKTYQKAPGDIIFPDFWEDKNPDGKFTVYRQRDYDPRQLTHGVLHCVTALTPVAVWREVGGYDETIPAWEDWDFQIKAADKGFCSRRIAAPLFNYRKWTGQRREANVADFERSKSGILAKWKHLWEGRETMACAVCSGRQTVQQQSAPSSMSFMSSGKMVQADAQLVQYTGGRRGSMAYRGPSGNFYQFGAGEEPKYVLKNDIEFFASKADFKVFAPGEGEAGKNESEPAIVADGSPN